MATSEEEWKVKRLISELRKETEIRDGLLQAVSQMRSVIKNLEEQLPLVADEESGWKERYMNRRKHNQELEGQAREWEEKLAGLKKGDSTKVKRTYNYDELSETQMKQLLKHLEKEEAELERELRSYEWRLDQVSIAVGKVEEEKKAILTELDHATQTLEEYKRRRNTQFLALPVAGQQSKKSPGLLDASPTTSTEQHQDQDKT